MEDEIPGLGLLRAELGTHVHKYQMLDKYLQVNGIRVSDNKGMECKISILCIFI